MTWTEIALAIAGAINLAGLAAFTWQKFRKQEIQMVKDTAKAEQTAQKWLSAEHQKITERVTEEWGRLLKDIREAHIRCEEERVTLKIRLDEMEDRVRALENPK